MFVRPSFASVFGVFKPKFGDELSLPLTSGLQRNNVPPEVELSEYRRIPSPGNESPSGLLGGEASNGPPITDLDLFFQMFYCYFCEKGLWCLIVKRIFELLRQGFTIGLAGFFLLCVDWNRLRNSPCWGYAVKSGVKSCDLVKEAVRHHPLTPLTLDKVVIVGCLGIFFIYYIICFLRIFTQLKGFLKIRQFYCNSLHVTDNQINTMPWATCLEKLVSIQSSQRLCLAKDLSAHDVVMRLMRKENYLIGMLNKGVLAFPISPWLPGAVPAMKSGPNGTQCCLILTKSLEWTLKWCILDSMFDGNCRVKEDFLRNPKILKKRLRIVGVVMLLISPFLVIFMLVYLFLGHAEQFYKHPSRILSPRWSNLSMWMFREYNEVDHLFKHRINNSAIHASMYLKQFPSPIISTIAKFIIFILSGFTAILIIVGLLREPLLEGHIHDQNLFWYAAIFGVMIAVCRALVSDELLVDPKGAMSMVVQHTHYMPKKWRGKESTEIVRLKFGKLFQYTGMMFLEEMASIVLTPYLLMFVVPKRVDDILQFIKDYTMDVEGVGHVCSFSAFYFGQHGNSNYGSPHNAPRSRRSSQGKMEKSFLSFKSSYPSWTPNWHGEQFLLKLRTFWEHLQGQEDRQAFHWEPCVHGNHCCSLPMIDANQNMHPYLLDRYYTSRPHDATAREVSAEPFEEAEFCLGEHPLPSNFTRNVPCHEDESASHLGASTFAPIFRDSLIQDPNFTDQSHSIRNQWWARNCPQVGQSSQTSILEPPDFNNRTSQSDCGTVSYRDLEDPEQDLDQGICQRLDKTFCQDDLETGDVKFHFDDIYNQPSQPDTDDSNNAFY